MSEWRWRRPARVLALATLALATYAGARDWGAEALVLAPILATAILCLRDRSELLRAAGGPSRSADARIAILYVGALLSAAVIGGLFYGLGVGIGALGTLL